MTQSFIQKPAMIRIIKMLPTLLNRLLLFLEVGPLTLHRLKSGNSVPKYFPFFFSDNSINLWQCDKSWMRFCTHHMFSCTSLPDMSGMQMIRRINSNDRISGSLKDHRTWWYMHQMKLIARCLQVLHLSQNFHKIQFLTCQ